MPNFRKGAEAIASAASKSSSSFSKTEYFRLDEDKKAIVRWLTDPEDWITVFMHQMVPTKGKPADYQGQWPQSMGAVCRKDQAFTGIYDDCYICDFVVDGKTVRPASERGFALICLREEVIEGGKVVGYRDVTREVTKKDKNGNETKEEEKSIQVVNLGPKNFFSVFTAYAAHFGTLLDRDYVVSRTGKTTDTQYHGIPLDPLVINGTKLDLRDPEFRNRYESDLDLEKIVEEKASDEYYARFFDTRVTLTEGGVKSTGASPDVAKPDNDADKEKLSALASKLKNYSPGDSSADSTEGSSGEMKDYS